MVLAEWKSVQWTCQTYKRLKAPHWTTQWRREAGSFCHISGMADWRSIHRGGDWWNALQEFYRAGNFRVESTYRIRSQERGLASSLRWLPKTKCLRDTLHVPATSHDRIHRRTERGASSLYTGRQVMVMADYNRWARPWRKVIRIRSWLEEAYKDALGPQKSFDDLLANNGRYAYLCPPDICSSLLGGYVSLR